MYDARYNTPLTKSKAHLGAWQKGRTAGINGEAKSTCPYRDYRSNYRNGVTYSAGFIRHWQDGWEYGNRLRTEMTSVRSATSTPL